MKIGYPKGDNYKLVLASLQPCQRAFIECLTTCSDDDLLIHLRAFTQWVWEKSDVICWASVLNRFDDIFSHYINLSRGYIKGECEIDPDSYFKEVELVKSALRTSIMIVENCGSKSTYNSVDLLVHLLDDLNLEIVYLSTRMLCVCFSIRNLRNSVLKEIPLVSQRLSTFVTSPLPDRDLKVLSVNPTNLTRKFNQGTDSQFSVSCPLVLEYYIKCFQYWVSRDSTIKLQMHNKAHENANEYLEIPIHEILNLEPLSQNESNQKFVNYSSNEKFVSHVDSFISSIDENQLYLHILKTFKYLVSKYTIDENNYSVLRYKLLKTFSLYFVQLQRLLVNTRFSSLICMLLINTAFYTQFLTQNPCFLLELSWFIKCHEYIDYSTMIVSTELLSAMIYDGIQYKTLSNLLGFGVPQGIYIKVLKSYLHHEHESQPLPPILKMKSPGSSDSSTAPCKDFDYRTKDEKEICMLQPTGYVCDNLEDDVDWKFLVQNPETREQILHDEERMRVLLQLLVVYYSIINYHGNCSALTSLSVLEMLVRFTRCRNPIYTPVIIYVVQVLEALLDYNQTVSRLLRTELHLYHVYISRIQFDMCKVENTLHFGSELCNKNSWPNGWILPRTNDELVLRVYWLSFSEFSARKFLFKSIIKDIYLVTRPYSGRAEINDYDVFAPTSPMVPIFLTILKDPLSYGHGVYSTVISLVLDTIRDDPVSQEEMHNLGIIPGLLNSINEETLKSEDSLNLVPTAISDLFLHRTAQEYYKSMKYSFVLRLIDVVVKRDFVLFHMFGEVSASIGLSLCTVIKHHETAHSLFMKRLIKVIYDLLLEALTFPEFKPVSTQVSQNETEEYLNQFKTNSPPMTLETLSLLDEVKSSDFYADRIANLGKCLSTFLSLKQSVSQFISCDGIKLLMQLCTVPCLPPMFPQIYPQHPLVLIIKYLTSQAAIPSIIHFHTISQHYLNTNDSHEALVTNSTSSNSVNHTDTVSRVNYPNGINNIKNVENFNKINITNMDNGLGEDWKRLYMTYHFLYMIHKDNFSLYHTGCSGAYQLSVEFENLSSCELHNTVTMCLNTLIKEYPRLLFKLSSKIGDDNGLMASNSYLGHEHPQLRAYKQFTADKKNEQNDVIFSANDLFWSTQCSYAYSTDLTSENDVNSKMQLLNSEELFALEFCRSMVVMSKSLILSMNVSINEAVVMTSNGNECLKTYICKHSNQVVSLFFSLLNNLDNITTSSGGSDGNLEYFRNIRYISDVLELVYKLLIDDRTSGLYLLTTCLFSSRGGMTLVCTCFDYVFTLFMAIVFAMALKLNKDLTMKELVGTKLDLGSFPRIKTLLSDFTNLEFSVLRNLYNPTLKCLQICLSLFSKCTNPRTVLNTNVDSNIVNLLSKYHKLYFSFSPTENQNLDEQSNIGRLFNGMILTCMKSCWSWFGFLVHMEPCTPSSSTSNPFFYIPTKILTLLLKVHIYYLDYLSPSRQQALNLHFASSVASTKTNKVSDNVSTGVNMPRRSRVRSRMVVSTSDDNFDVYDDRDQQDIESVRSYLSEMGFNERDINNAISYCGTSDIATLTDWLVSVGELTPENLELTNYSQVPEDDHINQKILEHLNSSYLLHLNHVDSDTNMDTNMDANNGLNMNNGDNLNSSLQLDNNAQLNDLQLNKYEVVDYAKLMNDLFAELKTQIIPYILKLAHLMPTFLQTAYDSIFKLHSFKIRFMLCVDSFEGEDVLKMFPNFDRNYETEFNVLNLMNFLMSKVIRLHKILQSRSLNVKNEHLLSLFSPLIFIYDNEKQLALEQLFDKETTKSTKASERLETSDQQDDMVYNYVLGIEHEHLLCYFYLLSHLMAGKENLVHFTSKLRDFNTGRPINMLNQVLEVVDFFVNLRSQCFSKGILNVSSLGLKRKFGLSIPIPEWCLLGESESWFMKRESTEKFEFNSLKYGLYATKCIPQISSPPPFFKYALICIHEIVKTRIIEGFTPHDYIYNAPSTSFESSSSQHNQKGSPVKNLFNTSPGFSFESSSSQSDRGLNSSQQSSSEPSKHGQRLTHKDSSKDSLGKDKESKESPNRFYKETLKVYKEYEIPEMVQEKLLYSCMKILEMFPGSDGDVTFSLLSILNTITDSYRNAEKLVRFRATVNKSSMDFLKILLTIPRSGLCPGLLRMISNIILHTMEDYATLKMALRNKIIQILTPGPLSFDRFVEELNVYYRKCPSLMIQLIDSLCVITVDEALYPNGSLNLPKLPDDTENSSNIPTFNATNDNATGGNLPRFNVANDNGANQSFSSSNTISEKEEMENTLINSENKVYKVKDLFITLKNHHLLKDLVSFEDSDFSVCDSEEYKLDLKKLFQILKTIVEFLHISSNLQSLTHSGGDPTLKHSDSFGNTLNNQMNSTLNNNTVEKTLNKMYYPYSLDLSSYFFLFNLINHNFPLPLLYPEFTSTLPSEIHLKSFPYKLDKLDKFNVRSLLIYVTRSIFTMICGLVVPSNLSVEVTDPDFERVQKMISDSLDNYSTALMLFSSKNLETCTCVVEEIAHVLHYISGLNSSDVGPYFIPIAVYTLCNLLNNLLLLRFRKFFDLSEVLSKLKKVLCQIIGKLELSRSETRIVCLSITRVLVLLTASGTASFGHTVNSDRINSYAERNGTGDLSEVEDDETALVVELEDSDEDNMDMDSHETDTEESDEMEESDEIEETDSGTNSGDMLIDVDSSGEESVESSDSENAMDDVEVSDDEANEEVALPHEVEEDYASNQYSETVTTSSIEDLEEEEEDDGPRIRVAGEIDETSRNENSQTIDTTTNISIPEDNESDSSLDEFPADFNLTTDNSNPTDTAVTNSNNISNNNIRISDIAGVQSGLDGHSIQIEIQLGNNQNLSIIDPSGTFFGITQPVQPNSGFNNQTSDRLSTDRVFSFNTFGNINLNQNNQRDSNTYRVDLGNPRTQGVDQRVDQNPRGDTWSNAGDLDVVLKNPVLPQFKKSFNSESYDPLYPLYLLILKKLKIVKVNSNPPVEQHDAPIDTEIDEQLVDQDVEADGQLDIDVNQHQDLEIDEQHIQQDTQANQQDIEINQESNQQAEQSIHQPIQQAEQSIEQEIDSEGRYYNRGLEVIAHALGITYGDLFTLANMDPGVIAELPEDIREEIILNQLNTINVDAVASVRQTRASSGDRPTIPPQLDGENMRVEMQYLESLPRSLRLDVTRALYGENSSAANEINASLDLEGDHSSLLAALGPFIRSEGLNSVNDLLTNLATSLGQNSDDNLHPVLFEAVRSRLQILPNTNLNNSNSGNNTQNTVNSGSSNRHASSGININNTIANLESSLFSGEGLILPLNDEGGIGDQPIAMVRDLSRWNTRNPRDRNMVEAEVGRTGLTLGFVIGEVSRQNNGNRGRLNRSSLGSINRNTISFINRNPMNTVNRSGMNGITRNTINSINRAALSSINRNTLNAVNRSGLNPVSRSTINPINRGGVNGIARGGRFELTDEMFLMPGRGFRMSRLTEPLNQISITGSEGLGLDSIDDRNSLDTRLLQTIPQILNSIDPNMFELFPQRVNQTENNDALLNENCDSILENIIKLIPKSICSSSQTKNINTQIDGTTHTAVNTTGSTNVATNTNSSTQTTGTNNLTNTNGTQTTSTNNPTGSNDTQEDNLNLDQAEKSVGMMGCGGDLDTMSLLSICKMFFLPVEMNKRIFFKLLYNISSGPSQADLMRLLMYILREAILGVDAEYDCPDVDDSFFTDLTRSHFSHHSDLVNRTKVTLEPSYSNSIMTVFESKATVDYYNFSYICSERVLEQLRSILIALPTTIAALSRPIIHTDDSSVHDLKRKKKRFNPLLRDSSDGIEGTPFVVFNPIELLFYATATNLFQSSVKHMNHLLMVIHNLLVFRAGANMSDLDSEILSNLVNTPKVSEDVHSEIVNSLTEGALGSFLRIYTSFTCQSTWLQMCNTKDANAQSQLEIISQIISVLLKSKHKRFVIRVLSEKFQLVSSLLSERLANLTDSIVFDYQIEPLIHTLLRITQLLNTVNSNIINDSDFSNNIDAEPGSDSAIDSDEGDNIGAEPGPNNGIDDDDADNLVKHNNAVVYEFFREMNSGMLEMLWNRLDQCLIYLTDESLVKNFMGDFYKETHIENQHYFDVLRSLIPLIEVFFIISQMFIAHDYGVTDLKFDKILANLNYEHFYNFHNLRSNSSNILNKKPTNDINESNIGKMSLSDIGKMTQSGELSKLSNLGDDEDMIEISENHLLMMNFVEKHKRLLNLFIKQTPSLLNGTFMPMIRLAPMCLSFDIKRQYFRQKLKEGRVGLRIDPIKINVRRQHVFLDSYHQLRLKTSDEMKGKLSVSFGGEEGVDAGGLTREWYTILSKEFFNPNYALFTREGRKQEFNHPNPLSAINPDHLNYFKFIGRVIGKALYDGHHMEAYFCRSFYKHMLGSRITPCDAESVDPQFYNNLISIRNCSLEQLGLELYFSTEIDEFGKVKIIDLVPNGRNILVTDENKHKYIQLLCRHKVTNGIKEQLDAFMQGFRELISPELISIFDDRELELLISGIPIIDLENMKQNVEYINYTEDSLQIIWLWEILSEFDQSHLAAFLQFVTGTSRVPIGGFKNLMGMRGPQKISIHKTFGQDRLPTAHTCFNQLDLPCYPDKDMLKAKLLQAILEGKEGFGFM